MILNGFEKLFAMEKVYLSKDVWSSQNFEKAYWRLSFLKKHLNKGTYLMRSEMEKVYRLHSWSPSNEKKKYSGYILDAFLNGAKVYRFRSWKEVLWVINGCLLKWRKKHFGGTHSCFYQSVFLEMNLYFDMDMDLKFGFEHRYVDESKYTWSMKYFGVFRHFLESASRVYHIDIELLDVLFMMLCTCVVCCSPSFDYLNIFYVWNSTENRCISVHSGSLFSSSRGTPTFFINCWN